MVASQEMDLRITQDCFIKEETIRGSLSFFHNSSF